MSNEGEDDKVGYKKPPRQHRFKPGQSGNPKGRKKGSISLEDVILKELLSKVKIREGDKEHKVTKISALIKSRTNTALKGDRHAYADVMKLFERADIDLQKAAKTMDLSQEDQQILALFKKQSEVHDDLE